MKQISRYSSSEVHKYYPLEIKIIELCNIGKKSNSLDRHFNDGQTQKAKEVIEMVDSETDFNEFRKWLSENLANPQTFYTLGRKIPFTAQYNQNNGSITIINSMNKSYALKNADIRIIFERWRNTSGPERYRTTTYSLGKWSGCPHRDAPAIPAIIRYWVEKQ